jgi:hypothetical protein
MKEADDQSWRIRLLFERVAEGQADEKDLELLCCDDTQSDRRPPLKAHHTHQTSTTTQKLRCKLSTTPCANTSQRTKRTRQLQTPAPNAHLITKITIPTCQRAPCNPLAFTRATIAARITRDHARNRPPRQTGSPTSVHAASRPPNPASANSHNRPERPVRPTDRRAWARNGANHCASEPEPRPTINWLAVPTAHLPLRHERRLRPQRHTHSPCRCESL